MPLGELLRTSILIRIKEYATIIRRGGSANNFFRFSNIKFDSGLKMSLCIKECVLACNRKLDMLLRDRGYFSLVDIMLLYKSHTPGFIEYRTSAMFHAPVAEIIKIDMVQSRFLDSLGVSRDRSFLQHKLAPLKCRRQIAILGVIHRACFGGGAKQSKTFFLS